MSYDSINGVAAIKVKTKNPNQETTFLFLKISDSSMRDSDGKEINEWYLFAPDVDWRVMQQFVIYASNAESGSLKSNKRDITPEGLIKKIRNVIEKAPVVQADGHPLNGIINGLFSFPVFTMEIKEDVSQSAFYSKKLEELRVANGVSVSGNDTVTFTTTEAGIEAYIANRNLFGRAFANGRVYCVDMAISQKRIDAMMAHWNAALL